MDHGFFTDRLSGYHDGDLKPEEMELLRQHVEECAECKRQLKEYRRLDELVAGASELSEGDYWEESARKIEARLGGETVEEVKATDIRPERSWLSWKIAGAVAAVLALSFIGLNQTDIMKGSEQSLSETASSPRPDSIDDVQPADKDLADESRHASLHDEVAYGPGEADLEGAVGDERDRDDAIPEELEAEPAADPKMTLRPPGTLSEPEDAAAVGVGETPLTSPEARVDARLSKQVPETLETTVRVMAESDIIERKEVPQKAASKKSTAYSAPIEQIDSDVIVRDSVTSVDELLERVSGVVADETGKIFIRGGRSGEVEYLVDGIPIGDPLDVEADSGSIAGHLDRLRARRDSLALLAEKPPLPGSGTNGLVPSKERRQLTSSSTVDQATQDYLEVLYQIGRMTPDETEYNQAVNQLTKYVRSQRKSTREQAQKYFKLLEGRFN